MQKTYSHHGAETASFLTKTYRNVSERRNWSKVQDETRRSTDRKNPPRTALGLLFVIFASPLESASDHPAIPFTFSPAGQCFIDIRRSGPRRRCGRSFAFGQNRIGSYLRCLLRRCPFSPRYSSVTIDRI